MRNLHKQINGWLILSIAGATLVALPLLPLVLSIAKAPNENWAHIREYLLISSIIESAWLALLTAALTVLLAVPLAWLIAAYDFPLKRFFRWALMLPLAIPPYIAAYTYSAMFSYTGIVQTAFRSMFNMNLDPKIIGLSSLRGAVFVFTLFLFPYVYIVTRSYLEHQSGSFVENGLLLGHRPVSVFMRLILPISRPAIAGGAALVVFEVLSDYGVVNYFGVQTISIAIFRTWFGMYDVDSAARLAAWLMLGLAGFFTLERLLRRHKRYSATTSKSRPLTPRRLTGMPALAACMTCVAVFSLSFLVPIGQLAFWTMWTYQKVLTLSFWRLTWHTLQLATIATVIIVVSATVAANACRMKRNYLTQVISRLMTAGYSIPGPITAIGVLGLFLTIDRQLIQLLSRWGMGEPPLVLSLSPVMLLTAYFVRFIAMGYHAVEAGFEKIGTRYLDVAQTLGCGVTKSFFKIDLHLIKSAIAGGAILTFVEIVKELPLTLLLRPFNLETLATKAYQYAGDERIIESAPFSLLIIAISMVSVLVFSRMGRGART